MNDGTNRLIGFAVAAVLAAPMLVRGGLAVMTQSLETTAKLGPVARLSGPAAVWMGAGISLLAVMVLSVAAAQWPAVRTGARTSAVLSLGAGVACLAAALAMR